MLAIETRYIGPTNYRGSRVKASVMEAATKNGWTRRTKTVSYDSALNSEDAHKAAAIALIKHLGWTADKGYGSWIMGSSERGYVFVCDTNHGDSKVTV